MSQSERSELKAQSQRLLDGPLKHIRGAALAAALLPLASIAATPAAAQTGCASGGCTISGTVFTDLNGNGIQDAGDTGIEGVQILLIPCNDPSCSVPDVADEIPTESGPGGTYSADVPSGTYLVEAMIPQNTQASPPNTSQGGYSVAPPVVAGGSPVNFGFFPLPIQQPGTGTPGYWKNHPDAWPVNSVSIGGVIYTETQAIGWLNKVGKDKTTTMFASLLAAILSVDEGNDGSCISDTISAANMWMQMYGPVGNNVAGGSAAWAQGQPLQSTLDAYDNGQLCAPHRQ